MAALFTSVWCLAGYFPVGRFLTLAIVAFSFAVWLFDTKGVVTRNEGIHGVLILAVLAVLYGGAQLVPLGRLTQVIAPGTLEVRNDFSADLLEAQVQGRDVSPPSESHHDRSHHDRSHHDRSHHDRSQRAESQLAEPSASRHDRATCLSLSRWQTKGATSTLVIGLLGLTLGWGLFRNESSRVFLLVGIMCCGATQVFWGVIQQIAYPDLIVWGLENPGNSTPFGTFLNRNHAADFLGMSIGCGIGLLVWCAEKWRVRQKESYAENVSMLVGILRPEVLFVSVLLVWTSAGLLSTLSRGGWISAALTFVVVYLTWRHARTSRRRSRSSISGRSTRLRRAFPAMLVAIVGILLVSGLSWLGMAPRVTKRLASLEWTKLSSDARFEHWLESLSAASHYLPMGSGLGTYGYAHLPFTDPLDGTWYSHAHNQYLEILVEMGIPGILILLIGMTMATLSICRGLVNGRKPDEVGVVVAALVAICMQAIHATAEFGLVMPANLLVFSIIVGAGLKVGEQPTFGRGSRSGPRRSPQSKFDIESKQFKFTRRRKRLASIGTFTFLIVVAAASIPSLVHLANRVQVDQMMQETSFTSSTPAPGIEEAKKSIADLSRLIERFPDSEHPRIRRARLRAHVQCRTAYDNLRANLDDRWDSSTDAREIWQSVTLENTIFVLHKDVIHESDSELQSKLAAHLRNSEELNRAWNELCDLLVINPIRPKAQLLLTQMAASTGRTWRCNLPRLEKLSPGDPEMSFAIGLLALSAGDHRTMLRNWRQTIEFDRKKTETIIDLSRQIVSEEEIVDELLPNNWAIFLRISRASEKVGTDDHFRNRLLLRAKEIINTSSLGPMERIQANYQVADQRGRYPEAAEWLLKAVQLDPHNHDLRYQAAKALVKSDSLNEAESQLRVGVGLAPRETRYHRLLSRIKRQNH